MAKNGFRTKRINTLRTRLCCNAIPTTVTSRLKIQVKYFQIGKSILNRRKSKYSSIVEQEESNEVYQQTCREQNLTLLLPLKLYFPSSLSITTRIPCTIRTYRKTQDSGTLQYLILFSRLFPSNSKKRLYSDLTIKCHCPRRLECYDSL